jgi:hypothetical protein
MHSNEEKLVPMLDPRFDIFMKTDNMLVRSKS